MPKSDARTTAAARCNRPRVLASPSAPPRTSRSTSRPKRRGRRRSFATPTSNASSDPERAPKAVTDASGLYEVVRRAYHAARPGFRIAELEISPTQKVPWHYHNNVHDTFYVVSGAIRIFLQQPKKRLTPGQTYSVP